MAGLLKVAVVGHRFPNLEPERVVLEPSGYMLDDLGDLSVPEVRERARDALGILVGSSFQIDREFIQGLTRCRGIVRYGIGVDNVDLDAANEKSIEVRNVPDYCTEEVSNHAISMVLALHRKLFGFDRAIRTGNWKSATAGGNDIPRLSECTLGLIGVGRIGREVARRAQAFGLKVIAYDPYLSVYDAKQLGIEVVDLTYAAQNADFISLHAPLTPETRHLVSEKLLNITRPGACVINVSRGALVDSKALSDALTSGRLAGAALDVFENEPLTLDDPILEAPNVILTPHVAWISTGAKRELQEKGARQLLEILTR